MAYALSITVFLNFRKVTNKDNNMNSYSNFWRRRRDSNSRDLFKSAAFPRRCTRPLCDASVLVSYNILTIQSINYIVNYALFFSTRNCSYNSLFVSYSSSASLSESAAFLPASLTTYKA